MSRAPNVSLIGFGPIAFSFTSGVSGSTVEMRRETSIVACRTVAASLASIEEEEEVKHIMGNSYEKPAMVKVGKFASVTNATRYGGWWDFVLGYYWF